MLRLPLWSCPLSAQLLDFPRVRMPHSAQVSAPRYPRATLDLVPTPDYFQISGVLNAASSAFIISNIVPCKYSWGL